MTKLSLKFRDGKFVVASRELPDPVEARELWKQGMSVEQIKEALRRKKKRR